MGFLTGTCTFTKYRVEGDEPISFREFVDERLKRFAFHELEGATDEKTTGWVGLGNVLDTEFRNAFYSVGDYLAFSMRIDRRSVPAALQKKHVLEAEEKARTMTGRRYLGKQEKTEIKDRVHAVLMSKVMAVPALFDVCWCVSEKWLLLASLALKVREDFENLFKRSFELEPVPFLPWTAQSLDQEHQAALARVTPASFA